MEIKKGIEAKINIIVERAYDLSTDDAKSIYLQKAIKGLVEQVSEESRKDEKERTKNLILKIESDIDSLEMGDGNLTSYDEAWDALKTNFKDIN